MDQARPGDFAENRLDHSPDFGALQPLDRRLAQELVLGTLRWQATLDWLILQRCPGRTQKPGLQVLLRLGLYQLFWLDRIPDHAVVNDTVTLAREFGFGPQGGFVNAVLRGYAREREATRQELTRLRQTDPATGWSFPAWLVERWSRTLDRAALDELLQWFNAPPSTFARTNTLRRTPPELVADWSLEDVSATPCQYPWVPDGIVHELGSHPPLATLPSFQAGGFYLQDPSTLLAVELLDPQPGESLLDLCAAPGGKTTYAAQKMNDTGRIVAHDPSEGRLRLLHENCTRLGIGSVTATTQVPPPEPVFDRILVDAPCSNTGVLRRRVELRWRIQPGEIPRLAKAQLELLSEAARRIRPGGCLVYSTCSLEPEENGAVVQQFLAAHPGFQLESERALHPLRDRVDGAFVARLRAPDSPSTGLPR